MAVLKNIFPQQPASTKRESSPRDPRREAPVTVNLQKLLRRLGTDFFAGLGKCPVGRFRLRVEFTKSWETSGGRALPPRRGGGPPPEGGRPPSGGRAHLGHVFRASERPRLSWVVDSGEKNLHTWGDC